MWGTVSSSFISSSRYQQTFQQKLLEAVSFVIAKQGLEFQPKNLRSCTICRKAKH